MRKIPEPKLVDLAVTEPGLVELRKLCKKAINSLPPADPGTPVPLDHELDCYVVASAFVLAQRLGLEAPALTAGGEA